MLRTLDEQLIFSTTKSIPRGMAVIRTPEDLTPTERKELATYMMTEWLRVYDKANAEEVGYPTLRECHVCGLILTPDDNYHRDTETDHYFCEKCHD